MRIKLKKKGLIGSPNQLRAKGWVGEIADDEAKALIAVGYAAESKEACTPEGEAPAAEVTEDKKVTKAKTNPPETK